MKVHELQPNKSARKDKRRIGRGMGSGRGKTSGKGTKGQQARAGGAKKAPFIGGSFPLTRTMPYKPGFKPPFRVEYQVIKVGTLNERFDDGATVDVETLKTAGLIKRGEKSPIKLLSDGNVTKRFTVSLHRASTQARAKIEAAGGTVTELTPRKQRANTDADTVAGDPSPSQEA
jgi:large subunit ribosomal protein L15